MATTIVNGMTLEYEIKTDNGKRCVVIKAQNGKLEGALEIPAKIGCSCSECNRNLLIIVRGRS